MKNFYFTTLTDDVIPFWLRHGMDAEHGGILTALDRDGTVLDTDKSIWFQGRAGWMFSVLCRDFERRPEWLEAARSCVEFLRNHAAGPEGKLYFTVSREGHPLRMRRYAFSESFAAIAYAVFHQITGDERAKGEAIRAFEAYLEYNFVPGRSPAKVAPEVRPMKGVGPLMIGMVTAQELRGALGDLTVSGKPLTQWIEDWIAEIRSHFFKPEWKALLETVAPDGSVIDHFDGRLLNPGHAMEAAWFILHEGRHRRDDAMIQLGLDILECMWTRGWDEEHGGIFYFRDLRGLPVQEYWQDMKFWWPHNEAVIATLLAWKLTGDTRWQDRHRLVHDWSFRHFADPEYGEWFGYLHRDGTPSVRLKGNMWKGPFHLPRMLWYCTKLLAES